jgi:GH25 family lysozyme M1 (1,4-beta-N-acetylmuramidase)
VIRDVSNNNGPAAARQAVDEAEAVYCKATEGLGFHDGIYHQVRAYAHQRRKPFGGYLFLHPKLDGAAQARYFCAYAAPAVGELRPVVDSETTDGQTWHTVATRTLQALNELDSRHLHPLGYGSLSFVRSLVTYAPQLKRFDWWIAEYGRRLDRIPGVRALLWQNTDRLPLSRGRLRTDGDIRLTKTLAPLLIPPAGRVPTRPPFLWAQLAKGARL